MGHPPTLLDEVFSSIELPCGRRLRNRLVKVAMYEHLARFRGGPPNDHHYALYSKWAESDWGMIVTGNVQVSPTHLTLGRDVTLPNDTSKYSLQPFKRWASSIKGCTNSETLAVMQLSHAGRQSANIIGGRLPFKRPLAPSPIRVKAKGSGWCSNILHALAFQTPIPMCPEDLDHLVDAFIRGAKLASESGFDGVQLHAAHGYLLAQFISPTSNKRIDNYSTHPDNVLRLLQLIISAIRANVAKGFIIGIKINAADYLEYNESQTSSRVISHLQTIALWGEVDFIEISGGDYENPEFMTTKAKSPRQALFSHLSKAAMDTLESLRSIIPPPLVLLTGGLHTPELLHVALSSKHAHLLGIGRSSVLCPNLPILLKQQQMTWAKSNPNLIWSSPFRPQPDLDISSHVRKFIPSIPLLGAGANMAWHIVAMRRLSLTPALASHRTDLEPDYSLGPIGAVFWMWVWASTPSARRIFVLLLTVLATCLILIWWSLLQRSHQNALLHIPPQHAKNSLNLSSPLITSFPVNRQVMHV